MPIYAIYIKYRSHNQRKWYHVVAYVGLTETLFVLTCADAHSGRAIGRASPLNYYTDKMPQKTTVFQLMTIFIQILWHNIITNCLTRSFALSTFTHPLTLSHLRSFTLVYTHSTFSDEWFWRGSLCSQNGIFNASLSIHMCEYVFLRQRKTCFNTFCTFWPVMWVS